MTRWMLLVGLLCAVPVQAQDAIILTPNGPVPMMHIPEAGTGALPGGGLYVPMTSPSRPVFQPPASRDWHYERSQTQHQLDETRRALEQFQQDHRLPYGSREGSNWGR